MTQEEVIKKDLDFCNLTRDYNADFEYLKLLSEIKTYGTEKENRTGINTISITGTMIKHNMENGFPLLTTKSVAKKTMATELEFFLKGKTDKQWLKNRGCKIWNEWSNPTMLPRQDLNFTDEEIKKLQEAENDLGPVYGYQWRTFNKIYHSSRPSIWVDQLSKVIETLKTNPDDRRMIVSAWNPLQLNEMALPPCHLLWHVVRRGDYLDLIWYQRSVDVFLGLPFNIASYGLLLELLAKQSGFKAGILTGMLGDTHIYKNHFDQVDEQLNRTPYKLSTLKINDSFKDVRDFDAANDIEFLNYEHHPAIKAPIAI